MSEEWQTERLDLDAYLDRIDYHRTLDPGGPTLIGLHRAHVAAIAFENLDIILGRGIGVDLDSVQTKLVNDRRGGYCYEHALLFAAVLERIGFTVDRLLARIGHDPHQPRPRTHMTLRVSHDDTQWLADVGFGAGLLEPLPWDETGEPHTQDGWTYRLTTADEGWIVQQRLPHGWTDLYSFTEEPQHASDVVMANHFTSTHRSSPFVDQPVVMRKAGAVYHRLRGRELTTAHVDGTTEQHTLDDTGIATALRDTFRLTLTESEAARLQAALPPPNSESEQPRSTR